MAIRRRPEDNKPSSRKGKPDSGKTERKRTFRSDEGVQKKYTPREGGEHKRFSPKGKVDERPRYSSAEGGKPFNRTGPKTRSSEGFKKPFDSERKPGTRFKKPYDGERKPTERFKKPYDSERKPGTRFKKPYDGESKSTGQFKKPFDQERSPSTRFKKPYDAESKPGSRFKKPYDSERAPTTRFKKPYDGDQKPGNRFKKPFDSERKPTGRFSKSSDGERRTERNDEPREKRSYAGAKREGLNSRTYKGTGKFSDKRKGGKKNEVEEINTGDIRLNRYISNAGICSRREADKLIGAGLVSVNGVIITEMGFQVKPGDAVKYNNSKLNADKKVYLLMNKPKDTITTLDDPDDRKIITDLLKGEDLPRVYPVGRLDRNTTGVILLTNDGELATRLMHPKYEVQKIYKATLFKNMKGEDLWTLSNGVELEDGFIKPDSIAIPDPKVKNEVGIEIHSGRNRIIHRMFEHIGYPLEKLDRVLYAGLSRKGLKKGAWRHLEDRELTTLKKLVKLR